MTDPRFYPTRIPCKASHLAALTDSILEGEDCLIEDVASLDQATEKDLTFFDGKGIPSLDWGKVKALLVIVPPDVASSLPSSQSLL